MPTELEELVGFVANPNPQIRLLAAENLVPYSLSQPKIFEAEERKPIKHLKFLLQDHPSIAQHAATILVNLSVDSEVLKDCASDEKFLDLVFSRIIDPEEPNANILAMLLANLAKWDGFKDIINKKQQAPEALGSDDSVINQLMDLFVKGQDGAYNKKADFDYLAYVFADLAKHPAIREYFVGTQKYDGVIPLTKIVVFTEHKSEIRRKGVASTIKNVCFDIHSHQALLADDKIGILPYILLPIMGNEEYDADETMDMLPELQLLPPDKKRDDDSTIIQTHVETLTLLTTTKEGRDLLRQIKVYSIIRETHKRVQDEGVEEACERIVQVLARDDEGSTDRKVEEINDEENEIVEV